MKFLLHFFVAVMFVLTQAAWAADPCPPERRLLQSVENGTVDWTLNSVKVPLVPDADPLAQNGSLAGKTYQQALSDLLGIVSGLPLDSGRLVEDRIAGDQLVKAQLEEIIATGPKLVRGEDGTATICLRLDGAFLQLILPDEIKQLSEIQTVSPNHTNNLQDQRPKVFSGLVVDARAVEAAPALVPEVIDENGRQVYGPAFVSREFAVQYGAGIYAPCINEIVKNRVGPKPLVIRALKAIGPHRSTLVISNGDASSLRGASSHLSFLRQARVAILIRDNQPRQIEGKP